MKKIVLFAAVICGLCGCVKSETVIPESEQHREIAFKPFNTKDAMRAPIDGTKLPDDAKLGVFAFYHGTKAQKYFEDAVFGKKEGTDNTWAGADRPYYWPTAGSLDFFAYHPKNIGVGVQVNYDSSTNPTYIQGFTGIAIDITDSQYDLMYSDLLQNKTRADARNNGLAMTLHHALAQVVVNIKKTAATPKLVVTNVTLNDVFLKAEGFHCSFYDVAGDTTYKEARGMWSWGNLASIDSYRSNFDIKNAKTDATTGGGKSGVTITTEPKQYGDGALIIPYFFRYKYQWQTSITIEYTFDNGGGVESEVVHTIDLNAGVADADKAVWEMGKKYTYNITIGLNEILFEPTVDEWQDAAGKDLTVE